MSTPNDRVLPQSRQPMPGAPEPVAPSQVIRSPAQIERDIEARRERLAGSIEALVDRVDPRNVVQRKTDQVRGKVDEVTAEVKARATDADGKLRPEVLGAVAGAVIVVVVLVVLARRRG